MDEPYYVGFTVDGQDIGLGPHGHSQGMTGRSATGTSSTSAQPCRDSSTPARGAAGGQDVSGGKLTAIVKDADGNGIGLIRSPDGSAMTALSSPGLVRAVTVRKLRRRTAGAPLANIEF